MSRKILMFCLWAVLSWQAAGAAETARRVALVIGNQDYRAVPLLAPLDDAAAMEGMLQAQGFEVIRVDNASHRQMREALGEFRERLAGGGLGLFYFAGHGLRHAGRTLLLPTDLTGLSPAVLRAEGIDLQTVLAGMAAPRPAQRNLLILDACLEDLLPAPGDAAPDLPAQTLVTYASAPGTPAAEGQRHGLFTAAWLQAMAAGGDVETMFRQVQATVSRNTGGRQRPWRVSSLAGDFRLSGPAATFPALAQLAAAVGSETGRRERGILPKDSAEQYEITFWESIKDSTQAGDYQAYLQAYPNGRFAALARARIEQLRTTSGKTESAPEKAPAPPPARTAAPPAERTPAERKPAAAPAKVTPAASSAAPPASTSRQANAGELTEIKDCPACPAMISLPRGSFTMGSNAADPSEKPAHHVAIGEPFAIGKYEVTAGQWNACVAAEGCPRIATNSGVPDNAPARDISWDDAGLYVKWLSRTSGKTYRLPSEAEWEYAARGGTSTRYWWGDQMRPGNADCKGCGEPWQASGPVNVGSFAANPYGLHDMNGSVWEWVADCWHSSYQGAPTDGRSWATADCPVRVIRGGSWRDDASYMLSSTRFKYDASIRHSQNGFRVAREVK
ncbi:MAG: SUMF1/EgtB/PvdO family nonheme iron enzyme [Bacteroidota bacterium]